MRFLDEYRSAGASELLIKKILSAATQRWTIMEICGGQTHTIVRYGIDRVLAEKIDLLHGPGCPVCVTPVSLIDQALQIASQPNVIFCSFGDMLRVPGSGRDLLSVKASGGDIRTLYSPLDAMAIARAHPDKEVVFFAVGFETTAPAHAAAVLQAARFGIPNFSILQAQVLVPPAIEIILSSADCRIQGFLAPGHVCTIAGYADYERLSSRYRVPIVVTGFEPLDILHGLAMVVNQLEMGMVAVENQYSRAAKRDGNREALTLIQEIFEPVDREWRGLGVIPQSGLALRPSYSAYDAGKKFASQSVSAPEPSECISGSILQGRAKPHQCPAFGSRCTPEHPLGAPMVSSEGACAAYFRYKGTAR